MNQGSTRPLALGPIRAFEAVARHLSFNRAANELHLTQSAVSRQIRSLEEEIGAVLFLRGTRHVELSADGAQLLRSVAPALNQIDGGVRQLRQSRGRPVISVTTFASFSSMWLIPRLEAYQRVNPDIDIRVSASDPLVDLDDSDHDVALRYCPPAMAGNAEPLFAEAVTPVVSPLLARQCANGSAAPLRTPADLARHALAEEDASGPSAALLSWRHWLTLQGLPTLQPRSWIYLNFTHQQIQAALAGQAIALARIALVSQALARGELLEPFGSAGRISIPNGYWLAVSKRSRLRPEVQQFVDWVRSQAEETRRAVAGASVAD
jgi:LysR family transcriptional regulator, glycine cleavage system transcriptional activator